MAGFCHPAEEFFSQFPEITAALSYQGHLKKMADAYDDWNTLLTHPHLQEAEHDTEFTTWLKKVGRGS